MKITLFLSFFWLVFASLFLPAEQTFLIGKITGDKGESLVGVSVKILKNKRLVKETATTTEGKYLLELAPDTYEVEFSHTGYVTLRITGVQVLEKQENLLHAVLESGATLEEVLVRDFKTSVTSYATASGLGVAGSDDLRKVSSGIITESIAVKGSRDVAPAKRKSADKLSRAESPAPKPAAKAKPAAAGEPAPPPPATDYDVVEIDGEMKKVRVVFSPETYEEKVEIIEDETVVPPPGRPTQPTPRAGLLTAGEWNDLHNWSRHWTDLLTDGEIEQYQTMYGFFPKSRYTVLLTNEQDFPIADAVVQLKSSGEIIWEARTDNTGKAELWSGIFDNKEISTPQIEVRVYGQTHELVQPKLAKNGINFLKIKAECAAPRNVDIVWAVDATGSMGDEIEYLKTELLDVIGRAKSLNPSVAFRMGTVFYRDQSDAYIIKSSGLSTDIPKTVDFIKKQNADGGGDYPEAVHSALEEAIFNQKWSSNAIARICFLVLDASPHQSPEVNASLQKSIREAARLGIRIVPVTASGIQKDTEFLMKFFGLATNGTYVFLTDHSGIGGKHLEPTSDEYKVEPLNELLVRLITEYTTMRTCEGKSQILFAGDPQQQQGQTWQAFYYPNPTSTQFTLDLPFEVQSVTIYDSEGKAVRKLEKPQAGQNTVIVSDLGEGFYTIRILKDGQMQSGKLMVVRA